MKRIPKKHLIVSYGGGGLDHLCLQPFFIREGDDRGNHIVFKWKDVTCKNCLRIGKAIKAGKKAPYGLDYDHVFWHRGKFPG